MSKRGIGRKYETQKKIVSRQIAEIESLKSQVSALEIDCQKKEDMIYSIEGIKAELDFVVSNLKDKREEYDGLISEVKQMRSVMNRTVFKGRWWLIKLLLK